MLDIISACLVVTALLVSLNHRFVHLLTSIGVMERMYRLFLRWRPMLQRWAARWVRHRLAKPQSSIQSIAHFFNQVSQVKPWNPSFSLQAPVAALAALLRIYSTDTDCELQ
jgi:hypothetical protein